MSVFRCLFIAMAAAPSSLSPLSPTSETNVTTTAVAKTIFNCTPNDDDIMTEFPINSAVLQYPGKDKAETAKPGSFPCNKVFHSTKENQLEISLTSGLPTTAHGAGPRVEFKGVKPPLIGTLGDWCGRLAADVIISKIDVSIVLAQLFNLGHPVGSKDKPFFEIAVDAANNYNFAGGRRTSSNTPGVRFAVRETSDKDPKQIWVVPSTGKLLEEFSYEVTLCKGNITVNILDKEGKRLSVVGIGDEHKPGNTYFASKADPEDNVAVKIGAYMQSKEATDPKASDAISIKLNNVRLLKS